MRLMLFVPLVMSVAIGAPCMTGQENPAVAQNTHETAPFGPWQSVDDKTGKVNAVVEIMEENGVLYGTIEKLVNPRPDDPNPRCTRCDGALKDRPLVGMRILWGMRQVDDHWAGGQILDPDTGKTYSCVLLVADGGNRLKVRGFIALSLLGRTQYWLREK